MSGHGDGDVEAQGGVQTLGSGGRLVLLITASKVSFMAKTLDLPVGDTCTRPHFHHTELCYSAHPHSG